MRLSYTLPTVQLCMTAGLLAWDALWWRTVARSMDMPGASPASHLLVAINAPLSLLETFVFRHLPGWWHLTAYVVAIALFWYWVGMNIISWRERRSAFLFSWMPLRLLADAVIIGVGVFWIVVLWDEIRRPNGRLFLAADWPIWLWYALSLSIPILWAIVLVSFFGYDCIHTLIRRKSACADARETLVDRRLP